MNTKTIFKALALAMMMPAMLLTTACSSDDDAVNDNADNQKKYYEIPVTVTVSRQGDEGTRAVYDNNKLSFSAGDKLFVKGTIVVEEEAYPFAGALDLLSATDGTFEGTVVSTQPYTGTAKAFLEDPNIHSVTATLLPAGYENYGYLRLVEYETTPVTEITPYTTVSNTLDDLNNSLLPLGKAEAVAQLSREYAYGYNDDNDDNVSGKVFALSPQNPVICCTISGLTANTSVSVVYDGDYTYISGYITTDGSGTATFAFTDFTGDNLGTLTVDDNAITLPSNVKLEAGKVYKITRSAAPLALNLTSPAVGQVIGNDGKNYDYVSLPDGVTAVAKICYVSGSNGLALALANEGQMNWSTAITTCAAHTPAFTGGTWKLATQEEWNNMKNVAGFAALRDGFESVGGSNMSTGHYWSSTEDNTDYAWHCHFGNFSGGEWYSSIKNSNNYNVRACLAF